MRIILRHGLFYLFQHWSTVPYHIIAANHWIRVQRFGLYVVLVIYICYLPNGKRVVNVTRHNVQIRVLCMMQVIKDTRFSQLKCLTEFAGQARLYINHFRFCIHFFK